MTRMRGLTMSQLFGVVVTLCGWGIVSGQDAVTISFDLQENTPSGERVGNVKTESGVLDNVTDVDVLNAVVFRFSDSSKYFVLDQTSGELTTSANVIDREEVCSFAEECVITFSVYAQGGVLFKLISVNVNILDENDNAPTFLNNYIMLNISEAVSIGQDFDIGNADDPDMGLNNSIQTYNLIQPDSTFQLIATPEKYGRISFKLEVVDNLNREKKDKYRLQVIVKDGGEEIKQGVLTVDVRVLDVNDNAPVFTSDLYNITVQEDTSPDTVVWTLTAEDPDLDQNGKVMYEISERQPNVEKIKEMFAIDRDSGALSVIKELTYERRESVEFFVDAFDGGDSPLSNQTVVLVNIQSAGNSAPIVHVKIDSNVNVNVSENSPLGTFVVHMTVEDTDDGQNGDISCSISDPFFSVERITGVDYKVVVNGTLDRETKSSHDVTVTCADHGTPRLSSSASFVVRILDKNDHPPVFDQLVYQAALKENNDPSAIILQVAADDTDMANNGRFEYILDPSARRQVSINNNTGVIYAASVFDREDDDSVSFSVLAVDKGSPPKTGTTSVTITILDENDNAPVITSPVDDLTVMENKPPGTFVGILQAKDADIGQNGNVTFSIAPSSASYPFVLYPNGLLKTTAELNREDQNRYEIPIIVRDLGLEPQSSTQFITVDVSDMNDNSPVVTFPNDINSTVKFVYLLGAYNVVTTVAAYDLDAGENQSLAYSIISGNELGIFSIHPDLGEISVEKMVDIQKDIIVQLKLEVKDKGTPPRATNATLEVHLVYANGTMVNPVDTTGGNKYIIISIVVVMATLLFALVIVGVIFFLRTLDRNKQAETEMEGSGGYCDSGISSRSDTQSLPPGDASSTGSSDDSKDNLRKKKGVSFSLDLDLQGPDGGRNTESTTDGGSSQNRFYDAPPANPRNVPLSSAREQDKIDSHMKSLKLQQYLWEAKARGWDQHSMQQVPKSSVGDSGSETSRETITCDSGRGGSDDDVSTSPATDDRGNLSFTEPRHTSGKHVTFLPPPYDTVSPRDYHPTRQSTPVHHGIPPPRPPPYRNPQHDFRNKQTSSSFIPSHSNQLNQSPLSPVQGNTDAWKNLYVNNQTYQSGYNGRMRQDSMSSLRSNEDDGGSTTTSGSYTLDPTEFDDDCFPVVRDLVV